jgi:protein gp37
MSTGIQWTDETWNPLRARHLETGAEGWACVRVSPGCVNCYAATLNESQRWNRGTGEDYTVPGLARVETYLEEKTLGQPLRWSKPRRVFVCSMTDLFGEWVTDGQIMRIFMVMAEARQHTFQVLTKRPERMRDFFTRWMDLTGESREPQMVRGPDATRERHPSGRGQLFAAYLEALAEPHGGQPPEGAAWPTFDWMEGPRWWGFQPPFNVWLGVSAEDQERADERIPLLLDTPAAVRFVSAEPLLGPIDFSRIDTGELWEGVPLRASALHPAQLLKRERGLDWVIVGGESGPRARPFDLAWARSIVEQCRAAGVAAFVKQLGSNPRQQHWSSDSRRDLGVRPLRLKHNHGGTWDEWPEDLRIREWPQ